MLIGTAAFIFLIRDFLQPIFWAILLAKLFHSVYRRVLRWLPSRHPSISAALVVVLVVVSVLARWR